MIARYSFTIPYMTSMTVGKMLFAFCRCVLPVCPAFIFACRYLRFALFFTSLCCVAHSSLYVLVFHVSALSLLPSLFLLFCHACSAQALVLIEYLLRALQSAKVHVIQHRSLGTSIGTVQTQRRSTAYRQMLPSRPSLHFYCATHRGNTPRPQPS